jgi:lipase
VTGLYVHRIGAPGHDSEPILALHGIRGWGGRWHAVPELNAYAPDLRGHGESPRVGPYTIEQHTSDVLHALDALGLERVRLLGLSFGGLIAFHFCLTAPERVARMVLLDPAIEVRQHAALERFSSGRPVPVFSGKDEAYATRAQIWDKANDDMIQREVDHHLEQGEDGRWRWRYEERVVEQASVHMREPAPFTHPGVPATLVLAGRGSLTGQGFVERSRSAGTQVEVVDTSHSMEIDDPASVARIIHRLLPTACFGPESPRRQTGAD